MASTKVHPHSHDDFSELQTCRPAKESLIKIIAKSTLLPVTLLIAFFTLICIIITILWFTLKPQVPMFQLNSLSVSTFNITNSSLTASWDVNLTFKNRDPIWNANFKEIECMIFFKYPYSLAVTLLDPFHLGTMEEGAVHGKLASEENYWPWEKSLLEEMRQERYKGSLNLEMTMISKLEFSAWWLLWGWNGTIGCSFLDLKVNFKDSTSAGTLRTPVSNRCLFV